MDTEIKIDAYTPMLRKFRQTAYSNGAACTKEIRIDARGDHVYIQMSEFTSREKGVSISMTRWEWNALKSLIEQNLGVL